MKVLILRLTLTNSDTWISRDGTTQFRLWFDDDNDDNIRNYTSYRTSNYAADPTKRLACNPNVLGLLSNDRFTQQPLSGAAQK